ncbi:MAG: DUF6624 domain-containing protein [Phycisphaerales bacterium]
MNRRNARSLSLSLTPALLLLLTGCADNSRRHAEADNAIEPAPAHIYQSSPKAAKPAQHDEFVLGESFDQDAVPSYYEPVSRLSIEQIRAELESMYDQDGTLVRATFDHEAQPEVSSTVRAIDQAHSNRLKEIVEHIGWPTRDLVGMKATQAAYMVIQHAGHDVEFQNKCLGMIVDLVAQGELPASYVALLTDRIRVFSNQPQVFGTQMTMRRNEWAAGPLTQRADRGPHPPQRSPSPDGDGAARAVRGGDPARLRGVSERAQLGLCEHGSRFGIRSPPRSDNKGE